MYAGSKVTQLVSEAFRSKQAQETEMVQRAGEERRAVRETVFAHANLPLKDKLSASEWITIKSVLVLLMPAFWFGVVRGVWGTIKVIFRCLLHIFFSLILCKSEMYRPRSPAPPSLPVMRGASKDPKAGLLRRLHGCLLMILSSCKTLSLLSGGSLSLARLVSMPENSSIKSFPRTLSTESTSFLNGVQLCHG